MKIVIEFFKNKWVIQLLGIIALGLLIWFFGPLIAVAGYVPLATDLVRLLVILIIVVLWGLNNLRIQLTANRANAQMANDLVSPSGDASSQLAKETDAEISTIANNFDEALQTLKKGSKNAHGKNYLYDLPWYIIIGPPGSGKTTALINSGLEFPLADKFGKGAVRGVGGTRNCDWWFTDQAVLLDTAGRYVTQDSHGAIDKAAWLGFLDLLKKHRPRRPVNGVLITMSLSDLLKQTEEERSLHAQAIRQRIEELHSHFGIRFPVYMLFTKADLIAGFNDFFAHLSKEERAQVWGVTFPEEDPENAVDVIARAGKDFDDLLTRLNEHLPKRLQEERDLQRRNLIFGFPQRMALLREGLLSFLQECYGANRYQSAPNLRGVYLTSGTQEGTPIDRLMGMLATTFKLDRVTAPLFSGKGKSYFITRLLKEVIFEEALLVGVNPRIERMQSLLRNGIYSAALVSIVAMSALWITSYNKNQAALAETLDKIQQYESVAAATPNWQNDFSALLKRLNAMQAIARVYSDNNAPWLMTFGLYQGDKIQPVIKETYNELLQKQFLPLIKARLEQRIKDKTDNPDILYSLLEVYLMLGDSKRLNPDLLRPWIAVDWENTYATDTETQAQLLNHLDNLLALPPEPQTLDQRLISAARQILNRIPVAQQIYMRIKNDALQSKAQDFKLLDALGINAERVFATKNGTLAQQSIPYLFTYDGFYSVFLKQSKDQVAESVSGSWVLGDTAKTEAVDSGKLGEAIRNYYYQDYIKYWDGLLDNLKIKSTSSAGQATEVLEFASSPDSPLRKLLEALNKETSLTNKPPSPEDAVKKLQESGAVKAVDSRVAKLLQAAKSQGLAGQVEQPLGSEVEQHFQPLTSLVRGPAGGGPVPLDRTLEILGQLYGYMIDLSGTSNVGGIAIEKAKQSGGGDAVAKMKMESAHLPEPLKSMTQVLAASNQNVILDSSKSQLNRLWQSEVMPLYQSGIQGRYPFSKASAREVTLEDFSRFFAQGGVVDQFFNNNLKAFVDTSGRNWRMITQNNKAIAVSSAALAQLQAATRIRQLFFAGGGQTPLVKFNLKPVFLDSNANSFVLNIEGQQIKYSQNESGKNAAFQWPGTDGSQLVSFGFETKDGKNPHKEIDGQWAWFRVLDMARIQQIDQDKYLLTFDADGLQARFELSASSVDNPFSLKEFANVNFPSSL
ncbi:MAG: type VI secretion system membrane subunit TssM [Methylococcales bacterium]|nr:type VI secretion system membrane subunit TssM [Methylococcales bacterium]